MHLQDVPPDDPSLALVKDKDAQGEWMRQTEILVLGRVPWGRRGAVLQAFVRLAGRGAAGTDPWGLVRALCTGRFSAYRPTRCWTPAYEERLFEALVQQWEEGPCADLPLSIKGGARRRPILGPGEPCPPSGFGPVYRVSKAARVADSAGALS